MKANTDKGLELTITTEEVEEHLTKLKNNKAAGEDDILNEMLKVSSKTLIEIYKSLFELIIRTEQYPMEWNTTIKKLLFKEGDRHNPSDYRGISLAVI